MTVKWICCFWCSLINNNTNNCNIYITTTASNEWSYCFLEAEVGSDKREWDGDSKPESKQGNQGAKRHRGTAAFHPQEQIQHKEHTKYDPEHNNTALIFETVNSAFIPQISN